MKKIVLAGLISMAVLVPSNSHASTPQNLTLEFNDTPCNEVVSGVMYCGSDDVSIDSYPLQTESDVLIPTTIETHTFIIDGYKVTTGAGEATKVLDPEVDENGNLTQVYYDRLLRQLCEVKEWFCEE